jgi:hypothetical protein
MHLENSWFWLRAVTIWELLRRFLPDIIKVVLKEAYRSCKHKVQRPKRLKPAAVSTTSATVKIRLVRYMF